MITSELISLSSNDEGFSIIESSQLRILLLDIICNEIELKANSENVQENTVENIVHEHFDYFKNKKNRMFSKENTGKVIQFLGNDEIFAYSGEDFVSDEENIGHPNIYWRCVRSGSPTDVGSVHADEWFWSLGHGSIPPGYTRVKTWIPIIQGKECGLTILPGSHNKDFDYKFSLGQDRKKRPQFNNKETLQDMCSANVSIGNAIIFNDRLLHGGVSSESFRLSVEWTSCIKTKSS